MNAQPTKNPGAASPNFGHLAEVSPLLAELGARSERYVFDDPNTALFKLRQFGEVLAQQTASRVGVYVSGEDAQLDTLRRLQDAGAIDYQVRELFHALRKTGNRAAHEINGDQRAALHHLRIAWKLGVWFQRAVFRPRFKSGPFVPPPEPVNAEATLKEELSALRHELATYAAKVARVEQSASQFAALAAEERERAAAAYEEAATSLELATEVEAQLVALQAAHNAQLATLQAQAEAASTQEKQAAVAQAHTAAEQMEFSEAETRLRIDQQLMDAGWEADSVALRHSKGVRPAKGRNMAIAEWPTTSGPADYVLFAGLRPVAVVEAKRMRKDAAGAIEQAKRYSRDFEVSDKMVAVGGPWSSAGGAYRVPFLFSTNGRPFLRQIKTKSGIWFLDARRPTNHPRVLKKWRSPEGLLALLKQDITDAEAKLASQPPDPLLLRGFQREAVMAVEAALAKGQQEILLAMATGTGKTRTALCLIYRLLKAGRFRRVLFLVDRTSLGEQAFGSFETLHLDSLQSLTQIYDVKTLSDQKPEPDTRVHIATVQGLVRRLLYPTDDTPPVPVDQYDCIIVDECHRGYNLDREMSDSELKFRSEADYIGKYRAVLDHFDAVRIGLTATPATHTSEIFGKPVYFYGYRQAVIDGYLIDHEPPIRIVTKLNQQGIHWGVGEQVATYHTGSTEVELFETPDEIDIEVEGFNTHVITESFNRVVCQQLAEQIDPTLPGKTMIFCATDAHADMVVMLLKEAFTEVYGGVEDDAVMKITGDADKPKDRLRHYKNERNPNVAVTVDLLTTGIDVPKIVNIVFIRRVRSRILYEQMLGRATRLCDEIGKEFFRIYDAVDLYAALDPVSSMKPVVTRPKLSFTQLVDELLSVDDDEHKAGVLDEIVAKLQVRKRRLRGQQLETFEAVGGRSPAAVVALLKGGDVEAAVAFFQTHAGLAAFLDKLQGSGGRKLFISGHEDEVLGLERGYGDADKPEDYLAGFKAFIEENQNALDALLVVTQRPRDLSRKQLRELKLKLDEAGYSELALRTAWSQVSNQDIAASIIGFIRQQALGSALVPYEQRVDRALQQVLSSQAWTPPQKRWLQRIGKQLKVETIVDREALDRGEFRAQGGFRRLNRIFGGKLEQVLDELHGAVWREVG